jgi:hypothetical protein
MSKLYEKIKSVEEFHETFKIGNASQIKLIDEKDYTLRYNLIKVGITNIKFKKLYMF